MYLALLSRWADPRSWPWFVFVLLAFAAGSLAASLWPRFKQYRARNWSSVPGRIESVDVTRPNVFFFFKSSKEEAAVHYAEIRYAYPVAGTNLTGRYKREFATEWEAREFLRGLENETVIVLFDPGKPTSSTLSESELDTLLRTRPRLSDSDLLALRLANSVPSALDRFLKIFLVLSGVGFAFSLWANIGALLDHRIAPEYVLIMVHAGILVVWIPAFIVGKRRAGGVRRKDFWKTVLIGAPNWMRYFVNLTFWYCFIGFFVPMVHAPTRGSQPEVSEWRQFSALWMVFYSAAFAIFYAASAGDAPGGRCMNGHASSPGANFCTLCGQPLRRGL